MKKIKSLILTTGLVAMLGACDMDKYPFDSIPVDTAVQSVSDCEKLRNGLYRDLRIICQSTNSLGSDFQADEFIPTLNWGNQYGGQYRWEATSGDDTFSTVWANSYNVIGQCNLMINGMARLLESGSLSEEDVATVSNIMGEAYLVRAYCYATLADRFCQTYDPATASSVYGVPLVTVYSPSSDNSTFPSRSTLAETYAQVTSDIASAKTYLTATGEQDSQFLTADAVLALEARVALLMQDYDTAISSSETLINSERYPLIHELAPFQAMWLNDQSTEVICQLYSSNTELAPAMGGYFLDEITFKFYILPSADLINMYSATDIRLNTFFAAASMALSGSETADVVVFNKYPGNPEMYTGTNNYVNKPKVFRIAEQYLIAAEAHAAKGESSQAYEILYALMSARDNSVTHSPVTGSALTELIREERERELVGEGFRFTDLKRYGEGFTRQQAQDDSYSYQIALNLQVSADNNRWVWAIPQSEMEANPQLKGQQNPGY